MRFLKRLAKGLLGLVALILLGVFLWQPTLTTRLVTVLLGGDQGPRAEVKGGNPPALTTAPEDQRSIPADVLNTAIDFGAKEESHALLIWQGGALQLEHYYPGYSRETRSSTASMAKSPLAMLIGIAIAEGKIPSVDSPVATWITEWANDDRKKITVRHLLQQSSGIDYPGFEGSFYMTLGGDVKDYTLARGVAGPPGIDFQYNNINPEVLGILLERATGQPYAQYLQEKLWQAVSRDDAGVLIDAEKTRVPIVFCCLSATAESWLRVGLLHLTGGRVGDRQVVPEAWLKEIVTPARTNPNYGYLTWLGTTFTPVRTYNAKSGTSAKHSEPFAAPDVIYFDGFAAQRVYIVPSKQLVIVRTGAIRPEWDDAFLPNLIIRALP
jgi:CubicO group peptidase (beta-lactamase class C family)